MDSCHVEKGGPPENHSILGPPPPPSLKADRGGGGGPKKTPSAVHRCACRWTVDLSAMFNQHSGPPPPPPPPTIKSRMVGGVRNSISTMDLGADASAVQMCAFVIMIPDPPPPPPPPPTVKGRTVGGVRKNLSTVDLSANSTLSRSSMRCL
jgi:hypothetical protein